MFTAVCVVLLLPELPFGGLDSFRRFGIFLRFLKLCLPQVDCDLETFLEKRFALRLYFVFSYNLTQQKLVVPQLVEPFLSKS
jgi:hypothetical protein